MCLAVATKECKKIKQDRTCYVVRELNKYQILSPIFNFIWKLNVEYEIKNDGNIKRMNKRSYKYIIRHGFFHSFVEKKGAIKFMKYLKRIQLFKSFAIYTAKISRGTLFIQGQVKFGDPELDVYKSLGNASKKLILIKLINKC